MSRGGRETSLFCYSSAVGTFLFRCSICARAVECTRSDDDQLEALVDVIEADGWSVEIDSAGQTIRCNTCRRPRAADAKTAATDQ